MNNIKIRSLQAKDSRRLWKIRNHPLVRNQSHTAAAISWKSHTQWLNRYLQDARKQCFVLTKNGVVAAYCRIDCVDNRFIVSIAVDPKVSRQGFGSRLLRFAKKKLPDKTLYAEVKKQNAAAGSFFEKNGFVVIGHNKATIQLQYSP